MDLVFYPFIQHMLQFGRDLKTALHASVIVLFTIVSSCVTDCNC